MAIPSTSIVAALLSLSVLSLPVHAQLTGKGSEKNAVADYPNKPMRFVVGLAAGGATDIIARLVGQKLTQAVGQSVIVDNRAGAAGSIAGAIVAKAPADGYTLLAVSSSFAINPSLYDLPFDSVKDFSAVVQFAQSPFMLVVYPGLGVNSVKDLVALAKSKPGTLNYSSGGHGGSGHMAGELFKSMANINVSHVPFRGGAPALTAVVAGQVQFTFSAIVAGLQQSRNNRVRALGVTSQKRSVAAPDVPSIAEAGLPGYEVMTWYGLLAPAGTPREIVNKLNAPIRQIVRMPDMAERFLADGAESVGNTPEEFGKHLAYEVNRFKKLVKDMGLKAESAI
jgi:tripartite-type tricarboxylate transporter receptor subunit TctC